MLQAATILFRTLVLVILAMAIVVAGVLVYSRSRGMQLFSVQTGSMRPAIRPGDAVLVQIGSDNLHVGDVATYQSLHNQTQTVTHRIVAYDKVRNRLTFKGDELNQTDPAVSVDRVIGRSVGTLPYVGYAVDQLRKPIGLALAVYVPSLILIIFELRQLRRYYVSRQYRLYRCMRQ